MIEIVEVMEVVEVIKVGKVTFQDCLRLLEVSES